MGLGLLASRTLRSSSSSKLLLLLSTPTRTIVSTPDLKKPEAAAEPAASEPDLPNRKPVAGARVHFPNPDDVIEVYVDGYPVKIPKGMTVLQACTVAGVDIPRLRWLLGMAVDAVVGGDAVKGGGRWWFPVKVVVVV